MIGYIRKDFYMLAGAYRKNLGLVFAIYTTMLLVTKNTFFCGFLIWMMGFYSLSAITMDEQSGWDRYARTLPVPARRIIAARFLVSLGSTAAGAAYALVLTLALRLTGGDSPAGLPFTVAVVTGLSLASMGLIFPAAYKWGVERARNTFLLIFAAVFAGPLLLKRYTGFNILKTLLDRLAGQPPAALAGASLAAGLLIFALGGLLSARVYERKEF